MAQNIYFTGFMASGKTRIGKLIAEKLNENVQGEDGAQWEYIDSDALIVEKSGKSIAEIFESEGEEKFRELEKDTIREIAKKNNIVVSLGGGAITQKENVGNIKKSGLLICMRATPEVLSERIGRNNNRPLMAGLEPDIRLEKIKSMIAAREQFYKLADFDIQSDETPPEDRVIPQILDALKIWQCKKVEVCPQSSAPYPIFIGNKILEYMGVMLQTLGLYPQNEMLICADSNVAEKQKENLEILNEILRNMALQAGDSEMRQIGNFIFPAGEQNKNLAELNNFWTYMLKNRYGRKTCLLQFSGGVVGDMAGFAAATYQRGIPFVQIPTTLLSMVDSSVGGKVAINHLEGKNMIGAFYQPSAVVCDLSVLSTLPSEEFSAGLAEIVKYGIIYDEDFFAYLEKNSHKILNKDPDALTKIISRSCEIKAEVVGIDEHENGLRAILNYGHTFGHAIEKLTDYKKISHGIAVGLGMRIAGRLSTITNRWSSECEKRQNELLTKFGIPETLQKSGVFSIQGGDSAAVNPQLDFSPESFWNAMSLDKKVNKKNRVYILPTKIGAAEITGEPTQGQVFEALKIIYLKK